MLFHELLLDSSVPVAGFGSIKLNRDLAMRNKSVVAAERSQNYYIILDILTEGEVPK